MKRKITFSSPVHYKILKIVKKTPPLKQITPIDHFPLNLLSKIISFMTLNDLMRASIVSNKWKQATVAHLSSEQTSTAAPIITLTYDYYDCLSLRNDDEENFKIIAHLFNIIETRKFVARMDFCSLPVEFMKVKWLAKIVPNIGEELGLIFCDGKEEDNVKLWENLDFSHYRGLSFGETKVGPEGMKAIAKNKLEKLEWIDLDNCKIGREGLQALLNAIVGERFKKLNLFGVQHLGDEEIQLIANHPSLRLSKLTLGHSDNNTFTTNVIEIMSQSQVFKSLTSLDLDFKKEEQDAEITLERGKCFTEFSNLKSLELAGGLHFTHDGMIEFCKLLPRLTKLKLHTCDIGPENAKLLSSVELFNLKTLSFYKNNIGNIEFLKSNPTLTNLSKLEVFDNTSSGDLIMKDLVQCHLPNLTELIIFSSELTETGLKYLLECDTICSKLTVLEISHNGKDHDDSHYVSEQLGELIAQANLVNLKKLLFIHMKYLTFEGARALSNANMPNLTDLNISYSGLTNEGLDAIVSSNKLTNIRILDVQGMLSIRKNSKLYSTTLRKLTKLFCSVTVDEDRLRKHLPLIEEIC